MQSLNKQKFIVLFMHKLIHLFIYESDAKIKMCLQHFTRFTKKVNRVVYPDLHSGFSADRGYKVSIKTHLYLKYVLFFILFPAMFTMFVCVTQDGWMEMFNKFQVGLNIFTSLLLNVSDSSKGPISSGVFCFKLNFV